MVIGHIADDIIDNFAIRTFNTKKKELDNKENGFIILYFYPIYKR
jgi:hypothetical protein